MVQVAPFSISAVRKLAKECGLEEICLNEASRVISFRRVSSSNKRSISDNATPARYNVYYSTGTVSTSLDHPRQGKTQLFRRNVDMDLLREIFLNPRIHTDLGYQQTSSSRKRICSNSRIPRDGKNDVKAEEEAARIQKEKLLAERAAIDKEIKECQAILDYYEKERQEMARKKAKEKERKQKAEKEKKRKAELKEKRRREERVRDLKRSERGVYAIWYGLRESDYFEEDFRDDTTCVAIEGNSYICLYEDGDWTSGSGITTNLHSILHTGAFFRPSPEYVAMGSFNRYYIRFKNGTSEWVGPEYMAELLQNTNRKVRSVAFGEDFEDFFIVFEDGYWERNGCPFGLCEQLSAMNCSSDLDRVSLGPNGEWFLRANGRAWWGNMSNALFSEMTEIVDNGFYITDVQFGDYDTYFVRYK